VGVFPVPLERASHFGLMKVDSGSRVTAFIEKPARPETNLASMGIYVFNADFLKQRLTADAANPDSVHDFGRVLLPQMVVSDRVYAYQFSGYWQDIGTPEAYHQANLDLVNRKSALNLDGLWPVYPCDKDFRLGNTVADSHVKNSLIGPGCTIKGYVENSILSPGVCVEEGAVVKNSVIMANVSIGCHTRVSHSILDEGAVIGGHCVVGSGADSHFRSAEITILGKNTRLPAHSNVGANGAKVPQPASRPSSGYDRVPEPAMS